MKTKGMDAALSIRDAAIKQVHGNGDFIKVKKSGLLFGWKSPNWKEDGPILFYRTPFQKNPFPPKEYPYRLDIWFGRRVFTIEWNDKTSPHVFIFRRGEWEKIALSWNWNE